MTMYAFSKSFFRPVHFKEPEMTLFIIYAKCTGHIVDAYWADSINDAFDAAVADGFDPGVILPLQATQEQHVLYNGRGFCGRRAYIVTPYSGEPFFVAADSHGDAAAFVKECIGTNRFCMDWLTDSEASEMLEPGWDQ